MSDDWHFVFAPYVWAMNQSGEVKIGPLDTDFTAPFSSALKSIEGVFMGHFEARKGRVGVATDLLWAKVGGEIPDPGSTSTADDGTGVEIDLSMTFWELLPYYRFGDGNNVFDVFGGIRYSGLTTDLVVSELNLNADHTVNWVDPIVGGRWIGTFSPKISVLARGDIGGFGAGSEFTFNLQGERLWQFSRIVGLAIGYRWLDYDYEEGTTTDPDFFKFDNSMHGRAFGLLLSW